MLGNWNSITK